MKHTMKLLAVAVATLSSTSAFATVDLDGDTPTNVAKVFAQELVTNDTTKILPGIDNDITVNVKAQFGISAGQSHYVRFDLGNGKFKTALGNASLKSNSTGTPSITLVNGGGANSSYAIFQVTAGTGGLAQNDIFSLIPADLSVTNKSSPIAITYSMYQTAADAVSGGSTGRLATKSGDYVKFGSGLKLNATVNTTTADVTQLYKKFLVGKTGTGTTLAEIGLVEFDADTTLKNPATGDALAFADLVATGTKLTVTGSDLSAASAISLSPNGDCTGTLIAGTNKTATTVDFVVNTTAVSASKAICFTAAGTNPVTAQDFTVGASVVPVAGLTIANPASVALGSFKRDGTVLKAPFIQGAGSFGAFVNLANTSNNPAPYTVRCLSATGTAAAVGTGGEVPAKASKRLGMAAIGCPAGQGFNSVEFTFAVPQGSVAGTVVRENASTGESSMSDMTGNL